MPASYWLLAATAVLMTADYWQTVVGLRRGAREANPVPAALEAKLGPLGLAIFQGATFALIALMVIPHPEQWSAPLLAVTAIGACLLNNALVMRKLKSGAGHD